MKRLVITGPPGVGKTTILLFLLRSLAQGVFVEGKVDVPRLKSFFSGNQTREAFKIMVPVRNFMLCASCGLCAKNCPFGAIYEEDLWIDPLECEGCGVCAHQCPQKALQMANMQVGEWVKVENEGPKILLYGKLMSGALGGALLQEKLAEEADSLNISPVVMETHALSEGAGRFLKKASEVILVLDPYAAPEAITRVSTLSEGGQKWIILNKSGLDQAKEEVLLKEAQDQGFKLLVQIPYDEGLVLDAGEKVFKEGLWDQTLAPLAELAS